MKRIVIHVVPEREEPAPDDQPPRLSAEQTSTGEEPATAREAMKVEAILTDAQAQQFIGLLLSNRPETDPQVMIEEMLRKQVDLAGPDAADLFDRIMLAVERQLISQVFSECERVKTRAAARLGIDRNTLHKKLRKYELIDEELDDTHSWSHDSPGTARASHHKGSEHEKD